MNSLTKTLLGGAIAVAALLGAGHDARAQNPCPLCGSQVQIKDIDKALAEAVSRMGLVRSTVNQVGQVNNYEMVGSGTMVDLEAPTLGAPVPVQKFVWNVMQQMWAARIDTTTASGRAIRVVKGKRAWDESWYEVTTKVGKEPRLKTAPADPNAEFRAALVWLEPHAFISHAVFASGKKCMTPEVKACDTPHTIAKEGDRTVVSVVIDGRTYKGTLDEKSRVGAVETKLKLPSGKEGTLVARYTQWRAGEADTNDPKDLAAQGPNALDKFRNGTFWPEKVVWTFDGQTVLDVQVTEGWANPYTIYPDPELLAKQ